MGGAGVTAALVVLGEFPEGSLGAGIGGGSRVG